MSVRTRNSVIVGGLIGGAAVLSVGVFAAAAWAAGSAALRAVCLDSAKELRELSIAHMPGTPVRVESANGSITLHKGGTDQVSVRATVSAADDARLQQIKVIAERRESGELFVHADFPGGRTKSKDSVSFEIYLPDATDLTLHTSNGSLSADGFAGKVRLKTSNARVTLNNHNGEGEIHTSNGSINASAISGPLDCQTSNASIKLADVAGPVKAQSSNGSVVVGLRSDAAGPVNVDTSNASITLNVGAGFAGSLDAKTSNAGVSINSGSNAWSVDHTGKSAAKVTLPKSGNASRLRTSNGRISVVASDGAPKTSDE